jgi:hypothetical protein
MGASGAKTRYFLLFPRLKHAEKVPGLAFRPRRAAAPQRRGGGAPAPVARRIPGGVQKPGNLLRMIT